MLLIKKGKEPNSLTMYKKQSNAYYNGYDKGDVRKALLKEQGYLCAYCMRRISEDKMKIEHYIPQSNSDNKEALNYNNMLGVCLGNSGAKQKYENLTCDSHRGNAELVVNPMVKASIDLIKYMDDGTIYSDNADINKDLNETLNLNCNDSLLKVNRARVLSDIKRHLYAQQRNGIWKKELLNRMIKKFSTFDSDGKLREYSGVILYYLNNRIKKC
ncbi:retron system putative HNH endonuclease [Clostridium cuniculi]|uniref:retron system putative HNH endonuclease n=1 Tax=Clostridium cuniculi TaxID=2548455 RepID=UPI00105652E7|nr:retron system putative HNH endonuclease [Clostridium cuniculi]